MAEDKEKKGYWDELSIRPSDSVKKFTLWSIKFKIIITH